MLKIGAQTAEAVAVLRSRTSVAPRVGLILGTGLGKLAAQIQQDAAIPYADIPHFPRSTVQSHAGQLAFGTLANVPLVAMEGRFHHYEGWSMQQITFPIRVMKALGVETLIVTNAAGGIHPQLSLADIVIIEDHINLLPDNPLRGVNDDALGPRFPDMSQPYDRNLIERSRQLALEMAISARTGVFVAVPGPNLETRAEYRMLKLLGADVVGMSTVPEVLVGVHAGLRVVGFSIVTDRCLPDALEPVAIESILQVAATGGERLGRLIARLIAEL